MGTNAYIQYDIDTTGDTMSMFDVVIVALLSSFGLGAIVASLLEVPVGKMSPQEKRFHEKWNRRLLD